MTAFFRRLERSGDSTQRPSHLGGPNLEARPCFVPWRWWNWSHSSWGSRGAARLLGVPVRGPGARQRAAPQRRRAGRGRPRHQARRRVPQSVPKSGWQRSGPKGEHPVGYTAICGLALVECGVPFKDPAIQAAVFYVGNHVEKLDHTYQLSLAILFLDPFAQEDNKFGKKCQELIKVLAMRLIAGQTQSGGWAYLPRP